MKMWIVFFGCLLFKLFLGMFYFCMQEYATRVGATATSMFLWLLRWRVRVRTPHMNTAHLYWPYRCFVVFWANAQCQNVIVCCVCLLTSEKEKILLGAVEYEAFMNHLISRAPLFDLVLLNFFVCTKIFFVQSKIINLMLV